jgi:hypothetical protein
MRMPSFTAEFSLGVSSSTHYRGGAQTHGTGTHGLVPQAINFFQTCKYKCDETGCGAVGECETTTIPVPYPDFPAIDFGGLKPGLGDPCTRCKDTCRQDKQNQIYPKKMAKCIKYCNETNCA